jgi:hypothetical protein
LVFAILQKENERFNSNAIIKKLTENRKAKFTFLEKFSIVAGVEWQVAGIEYWVRVASIEYQVSGIKY